MVWGMLGATESGEPRKICHETERGRSDAMGQVCDFERDGSGFDFHSEESVII